MYKGYLFSLLKANRAQPNVPITSLFVIIVAVAIYIVYIVSIIGGTEPHRRPTTERSAHQQNNLTLMKAFPHNILNYFLLASLFLQATNKLMQSEICKDICLYCFFNIHSFSNAKNDTYPSSFSFKNATR